MQQSSRLSQYCNHSAVLMCEPMAIVHALLFCDSGLPTSLHLTRRGKGSWLLTGMVQMPFLYTTLFTPVELPLILTLSAHTMPQLSTLDKHMTPKHSPQRTLDVNLLCRHNKRWHMLCLYVCYSHRVALALSAFVTAYHCCS